MIDYSIACKVTNFPVIIKADSKYDPSYFLVNSEEEVAKAFFHIVMERNDLGYYNEPEDYGNHNEYLRELKAFENLNKLIETPYADGVNLRDEYGVLLSIRVLLQNDGNEYEGVCFISPEAIPEYQD